MPTIAAPPPCFGGAYALTLTYPKVARAGLDVPRDLTVRKPGSSSEPVVIVVESDCFDIFETQGWTPEPSAETSDASRTYMTVDPPRGDTLTLGFDTYIQPSSQLGHSGSVSVSEKGVDVGSPSSCRHSRLGLTRTR